MKFTNESSVPLPLAVWAVDDDYDFINDPDYFSVTSLLKPIRQVVLSKRIDPDSIKTDVEGLVAIAMGKSIHAGIERAWTRNLATNLKLLGYQNGIIKRFKVNPETISEGDIPVYIEQRKIKDFEGFKIGGKYDMVLDGVVYDNKSTSTFKWTNHSSDDDYIKQGSLYRWLNQDKITSDYIRINFIFTDWSKLSAIKDPEYPQHKVAYRDYPLMSIPETEKFLREKLAQIKRYWNSPDDEIPECTDEELWRTPTKYKYFVNPSASRATKNFDSLAEAKKWMADMGKGVIRIVPGEARRCNYCNAAPICEQYKRLHSGSEQCS